MALPFLYDMVGKYNWFTDEMLTNMIAIGLCLNVGLRREVDKSIFVEEDED